MNRSIKIKWLASILLLLLAACDSTPRLALLSVEGQIVAFGDSLTQGKGVGENGSYPYQLEQLIGLRVINAGVSGELSAEGLKRLPEVLENYHPQLLILCHGGNDLLRRLDRETLRENLRQMIRLAQKSGAEVILIGVPNPGLQIAPPALYAELAAEFRLPYQGEVLAELMTEVGFKSDAVHLNAAGYHRLAESLAELLKKAKAI